MVKILATHTITIEVTHVRFIVFLTQFFNSALVNLLIGGNVAFLDVFGILDKSRYGGFTRGWFKDLGAAICTNLLMISIFPWINFGLLLLT